MILRPKGMDNAAHAHLAPVVIHRYKSGSVAYCRNASGHTRPVRDTTFLCIVQLHFCCL